MKHSKTSKILSTTLAFALCGLTQTAVAWQQPTPQDRPLQNQSQVPQQVEQKAAPVEQPRDPNPSLKERTDDQEQLPNAPSSQPQTVTNGEQPATQPAQQQKPQNVQPLGTAAAESGKVVGGPASRPAGMAIAPAKQKRTRSLLLKVGAVLGGAAALGTVYALSKGSSSTPPGAK